MELTREEREIQSRAIEAAEEAKDLAHHRFIACRDALGSLERMARERPDMFTSTSPPTLRAEPYAKRKRG